MIKSFRDKDTERLFNRGGCRKFSGKIGRVAMRKLWMLDAAHEFKDLRVPPGNRLERLKGKKWKDQYSIRINKQWRICFDWQGGEVHNVQIIDYHS